MTAFAGMTSRACGSRRFRSAGSIPTAGGAITFIEPERRLIGCLLARGDADTPYTVVMQPWGTVTGQIVDENGRPAPTLLDSGAETLEVDPDPTIGVYEPPPTDQQGRFRLERLVPGLRYSAKMYRGIGNYAGIAFENLVLAPGEVRDLGVIRSLPPVDVRGKSDSGRRGRRSKAAVTA